METYELVCKIQDHEMCEEIYSRAIPLEPESVLIVNSNYHIERYIRAGNLFYVHKDNICYDKNQRISSYHFKKICWYMLCEDEE